MVVDRYTKALLTVIALCLVWLSLGGPSLITPANAQSGDKVFLAGWIDETGAVKWFPKTPVTYTTERPGARSTAAVVNAWPLPIWDAR